MEDGKVVVVNNITHLIHVDYLVRIRSSMFVTSQEPLIYFHGRKDCQPHALTNEINRATKAQPKSHHKHSFSIHQTY
jgi:hypothetical protein